MMTAFIRVQNKSNKRKWYDKHVGKVYPLLAHDLEEEYLVIAEDGFTNYIMKDDAQIVIKDERNDRK